MIGAMREQISIEEPTMTSDTYGGNTRAWNSIATVWANVKPVSAAEKFFAGKVEMDVSHKIKIRYRDDVNATQRIVYGARTFIITGVRNIDELDKFLEILAREETV